MKMPTFRKTGRAAVLGLALLLLAAAAPESARESGPGDSPRAHPRAQGRVEPRGDEHGSLAVARSLERLRNETPPEDEVFALIKVTDRATGERRHLTRGQADPRIAGYLDHPRSAPPGSSYFEVEQLYAEGGVEIAIRSVRVRDSSPFEGEPTVEEAREQALLDRLGMSETDHAGSGVVQPGPDLPVDPTPFLSHRIGPGIRERVARGDIDLKADDSTELLPVMIAVKSMPELRLPKSVEPDQGGLIWVGLELAAARERTIIERKLSVADLQAPLIRAVEDRGGLVEYASWMSGLLQTRIPAAAIVELADHSSVLSLEWIPEAETLGHRFRGDDVFISMNAEDFYASHSGFNGLFGKHPSSSRVTVSLGEECIDTGSPAWLTLGPGSQNRGRFYDCDRNPCTLGGLETCWDDQADDDEWPPHGHYVTGVMTGDLMDGQVPGLSFTERRRITGTCPECFFFFFQDQNLNNRTRVHDLACEKGVDIFEASLGWSSGTICNGEGFMDASVQDLINCDAAFVVSAGNRGSPGCDQSCCDGSSYFSCSTLYPADHPWTLAVSGIDTEDPCTTPGDYYTSTCVFDECSSRGGGSYSGWSGKASIVDLAAPWRVGMGITPGTVSASGSNLVGTSFGAPLLAGLMANLMDWWKVHLSNSIFYNNRARNIMLLMGDRSGGRTGANQNVITPNKYWGAGRVTLMPFDKLSSYVVQRYQVTLSKNESFNFSHSLPGGTKFYKAVLWHTGKDYVNEPRIDLVLDPTGCGKSNLWVNRLDSKSYAAYKNIAGCSGMNVTFKNTRVGTSGTRTFHFAAYAVSQTNERQF